MALDGVVHESPDAYPRLSTSTRLLFYGLINAVTAQSVHQWWTSPFPGEARDQPRCGRSHVSQITIADNRGANFADRVGFYLPVRDQRLISLSAAGAQRLSRLRLQLRLPLLPLEGSQTRAATLEPQRSKCRFHTRRRKYENGFLRK